MADLQYTFIYDMPGHGFTETHWRQSNPAETFPQSLTIGVELARRRQAMSGKETTFQALRIGNGELEGRGGHLHYNGILGNQDHESESSATALNIRIGTANNAQEKTTQFRGFWDSEEVTGGAVLKSAPFTNAFQSWAQYFVANAFGWRGVVSETQFPISNYSVNSAGIVTMTVIGALAGVMPLNKTKTVRISGVNSGKSQLNGEQVAIYTGASVTPGSSEVVLKFPKAVLAFAGIGFLNVQSFTFRAAATIEMGRLGKRQAGAPLLRSRGRSGKRIRV